MTTGQSCQVTELCECDYGSESCQVTELRECDYGSESCQVAELCEYVTTSQGLCQVKKAGVAV